jgi:hypothetical protein
MLQTALAKHPDIVCEGELLHEFKTSRDYKSIFQQQTKKAVGFKLQEYQGYDTDLRQYLREAPIKVILLTRRDRLELLVSLEVAKQFDYWHTRGMPFPATKISITQKQYREPRSSIENSLAGRSRHKTRSTESYTGYKYYP